MNEANTPQLSLYLWIHEGRVVGLGDTRSDAWRSAVEAIKAEGPELQEIFRQADLDIPEDLLAEVLNPPGVDLRQDGYGVRLRFSKYKEGEDPRTALIDTLSSEDFETFEDEGVIHDLGNEDEGDGESQDGAELDAIARQFGVDGVEPPKKEGANGESQLRNGGGGRPQGQPEQSSRKG